MEINWDYRCEYVMASMPNDWIYLWKLFADNIFVLKFLTFLFDACVWQPEREIGMVHANLGLYTIVRTTRKCQLSELH